MKYKLNKNIIQKINFSLKILVSVNAAKCWVRIWADAQGGITLGAFGCTLNKHDFMEPKPKMFLFPLLQVNGGVQAQLEKEVLHYDYHSSFFDIFVSLSLVFTLFLVDDLFVSSDCLTLSGSLCPAAGRLQVCRPHPGVRHLQAASLVGRRCKSFSRFSLFKL